MFRLGLNRMARGGGKPAIPNSSPADILLSASSIAEGNLTGAIIGAFSTTDEDIGDTFTYDLITGIGDTDNSSFVIDGADLKASEVFDYSVKSSYSMRVRSTDAGGLYTEKSFTITIISTNVISDASQASSIFGSAIVGFWKLDDANSTIIDYSGNGNNIDIDGTPAAFQTPTGIDNAPLGINLGGSSQINYNGALGSFDPNEGGFSVWLSPFSINDLMTSGDYIFYHYIDGNNRIFARPTVDGKIEFYHIAGGFVRSMNLDAPLSTRYSNLSIFWSKSQAKIKAYINGVKHSEVDNHLGSWSGGSPSYHHMFGAFSNARINTKALNLLILNNYPTDSNMRDYVNPSGLYCFSGDSRTNQKGWTCRAAEASISGVFAFNRFGVVEDGVSGDTTSDLAARASATNAKMGSETNILIVWIGVNSSGDTATQLYDAIGSYCTAARSAGWNKIIVCTEIDAQSAVQVSNDWSSKYLSLNTLLRDSHSFCDAIADLGSHTELQDATDTTYYLSDKLHLTANGYAVVANTIKDAIESL